MYAALCLCCCMLLTACVTKRKYLEAEGRANRLQQDSARYHTSLDECTGKLDEAGVRIRNLEKSGVLRGYRADIDRKEVGLGLTVFVEIKVGHHNRENAVAQQEALLAVPEIVSCFLISGNADFLAEVVVEDLPAYEKLLTETLLALPGVTDIRSNFAIRSIKTGGPLKLPEPR